MQKVKDIKQALFYINKTIENNWSRAVLEYQIESNLYGRQGLIRHCGLDPQSPVKQVA
jgi:predicted nuclease of restriction endonuclease-like (RecB) superfamily